MYAYECVSWQFQISTSMSPKKKTKREAPNLQGVTLQQVPGGVGVMPGPIGWPHA